MLEDHRGSWTCPVCGKSHSKAHYAFPRQIDKKLEPDTPGRVKFDREDKGYCESAKGDTKKKYGNKSTGQEFDKKGVPRPLFCPHCGWEQEQIIINKIK
jgi:rubredoxin